MKIKTFFQVEKKKQPQGYNKSIFYFCLVFTLFHQGIVITVKFKMLHTFLLKKDNQNVKQKSNSVIQATLIGKNSLFYLKWV